MLCCCSLKADRKDMATSRIISEFGRMNIRMKRNEKEKQKKGILIKVKKRTHKRERERKRSTANILIEQNADNGVLSSKINK